MTLSAIAKLLVEDYLPECRKTYLFNNYKQSNMYRSYKDIVPEYLQDRPRNIILHCLDRQATSMQYKEEDIVDVDADCGVFKVIKDNKYERTVDFGYRSTTSVLSCNCLDWEKFHLPCKHFFAVFRLRPSWTWNRLPQHYLKSAYLSLDNKALKDFYEEPSPIITAENDYTSDNDLGANFKETLPSKKVVSVFQQAQKTRVTLKMIETLTYSCQDSEKLAEINSKLEDIFNDMKVNMNHSEGLIIRPVIAKRAKEISQKYRSKLVLLNKSYSALPARKKRGRQRKSALFRNRVGQKAQRMRKVHVQSL